MLTHLSSFEQEYQRSIDQELQPNLWQEGNGWTPVLQTLWPSPEPSRVQLSHYVENLWTSVERGTMAAYTTRVEKHPFPSKNSRFNYR